METTLFLCTIKPKDWGAAVAAFVTRHSPYGDIAAMAPMANDAGTFLAKWRTAISKGDDGEAERLWRLAEARLSCATGHVLLIADGYGAPILKAHG